MILAYSTILELDSLLTKTEAECIPEGFKNPSLSDLAEKPYLRGAYAEIQIRKTYIVYFVTLGNVEN